jgi:hypothetical protein
MLIVGLLDDLESGGEILVSQAATLLILTFASIRAHVDSCRQND